MNEEQIKNIEEILANVKTQVADIEQMLQDYGKCESEISKKYLGAAVVKMVSVFGTAFGQVQAK